MHGRLHTDRHATALSAISGSAARRSRSAAYRPRPHRPLVRLAGHADEQGRGGTAAVGVHRRVNPSRRTIGAARRRKSAGQSSSAPWPPLRRPCGIHRRTAGLLACGVSPTPPSRTCEKPSGKKSVGTPLTVAGAATDRRKGLPCSLFTLGRDRGTVLGFMSQLRDGLSNRARNAFARLEAGKPRRPWLRAKVGRGSKH